VISNLSGTGLRAKTYQVKNRHLHHTLVEVGSSVFDHLDSDHLLRLEILALHDLPEGALTENIKN
jgi:hypothetical protein